MANKPRNTAVMYLNIPNSIYDAILKESKNERRSISGHVTFILDAHLKRKAVKA